jgi:hypothetical protein
VKQGVDGRIEPGQDEEQAGGGLPSPPSCAGLTRASMAASREGVGCRVEPGYDEERARARV